jgi:hypothetical protein
MRKHAYRVHSIEAGRPLCGQANPHVPTGQGILVSCTRCKDIIRRRRYRV